MPYGDQELPTAFFLAVQTRSRLPAPTTTSARCTAGTWTAR
jgi:hypothetical protein